MAISVLLALIFASGAIALDPDTTTTTATEKETEEETITYGYTSTTDNAWTSTTPNPNEWSDLDQKEAESLVSFVVAEIQKLKVEHKELDDCQELDLSSVLSGKKQVGNPTKYSVTLKVQPQLRESDECKQDNSTVVNMHPEICEADILDGDRGGTKGKTLLRSTCLQVEELQD